MPNQTVSTLFSNVITSNSFSHAYLFHGINQQDLYLTCIDLIKDFLNHHHPASIPKDGDLPIHPDIFILEDENSIKIDHIKMIQDKIKFGPYSNLRLFVVVQNIDRCSIQAANAFLKTLEEPIDNVIFFLTTTNLNAVLPTIRSRCISIYTTTSDFNHVDDDICTFSHFKSCDSNQRLQLCLELSSDKHRLLQTLHNWLVELTATSSCNYSRDSNLILNLIETLQFNVNVRLQLESFSFSL